MFISPSLILNPINEIQNEMNVNSATKKYLKIVNNIGPRVIENEYLNDSQVIFKKIFFYFFLEFFAVFLT